MSTSCSKLNIYTVDNTQSEVDSLIASQQAYRPQIRIDDKVSVSVWGHEGMSIGSVFGIYNSNEVFGKWLLVNQDSTIILPKIGQVKIGGMTMEEAKAYLTTLYAEHLKAPVIDIKVHSHEVTVLGQVIKPGNYAIYRGQNSLGYMIGAAGGTDYYAQLHKVKLARGDMSYELDLTKMTPLQMNRINLLPGDILYFPTKKGKSLDKKSPVLLAAASIITTLFLIFSASQK